MKPARPLAEWTPAWRRMDQAGFGAFNAIFAIRLLETLIDRMETRR